MNDTLTITPEQLTEIFRMFKIDMSEWGTPGRRQAGDLIPLLKSREGVLTIGATGIALKFETARALIKNAKGEVLICGGKNLHGMDNSSLIVASLPGGKMGEDEDPLVALQRELFEEMGLQGEDYHVGEREKKKSLRFVRALPGFQAQRMDYIFTVTLRPDHPYFAQASFEREEHGYVILFKWVPEVEWNERQQKPQQQQLQRQ